MSLAGGTYDWDSYGIFLILKNKVEGQFQIRF